MACGYDEDTAEEFNIAGTSTSTPNVDGDIASAWALPRLPLKHNAEHVVTMTAPWLEETVSWLVEMVSRLAETFSAKASFMEDWRRPNPLATLCKSVDTFSTNTMLCLNLLCTTRIDGSATILSHTRDMPASHAKLDPELKRKKSRVWDGRTSQEEEVAERVWGMN